MQDATGDLEWLVEQTLEEFEDETTETATLPVAFAQMTADLLAEAGHLTSPLVGHSVRRGARVSIADWDDDRRVLTLSSASYLPDGDEVASFDAELRGLQSFFAESLASGSAWLPSDDPATELALTIRSLVKDIDFVRLMIVTTAKFTGENPDPGMVSGFPAGVEIWDAARLGALRPIGGAETFTGRLTLEFPDASFAGAQISAIGPFISKGDYEAYIAVLPGDLLADLYAEHGARLLEMNVRSFLQARNRINKGIQQTLKTEPGRFLAYNNGLSITASAVEMDETSSAITALRGFQIVNGGQTTASLHHAKYRQSVDLSDVRVQAKITVVPDAAAHDLAPKVSQFANAQNPVRMADFTANNPFHIALETVSRETPAPSTGGTTYWYYERSRGRYADDLAAAGDRGEQADFKRRNPPAQKLTKLDLAKLELTWEQRPNIVALGGEKSFAWYMQSLRETNTTAPPDATFFHDLVAKAILWRTTDRLVAELDLGGYKAQAVAYTLGLLSNRSAQRLDLEGIWDAQSVPDDLQSAIRGLAPLVHAELVSTAGTRNVTEWAKKDECWEIIREIEWAVPESLLVTRQAPGRRVVAASGPKSSLPASVRELADEARVVTFGSKAWYALSAWAKDTDNFQPWQRSIAFSMGRLISAGKAPTAKQVVQAVKILDEAERLGFDPDEDRQVN